MRRNIKLLALAAVPVAIGGWALFRPELLFVNSRVNDKLPVVAGQTLDVLAMGSFTSEAHETTGKAEVIRLDEKTLLRLSNFHTSSGPDVRVYLVKRDGSRVGLGGLKGNLGDQNYAIPAGTNVADLASVSIWCERFSVGFGHADLSAAAKPKPSAFRTSESAPELNGALYGAAWRTVSFAPIEVTFGNVKGDKRFAGRAALVENEGKRHLALTFKKLPEGSYEARLVKKETLTPGAFPDKVEFANLGALKKGSWQVPVDKALDLWLYRSVAILDKKSGKIVATVDLRSAQELKKPALA